jgi:hypothetical protein
MIWHGAPVCISIGRYIATSHNVMIWHRASGVIGLEYVTNVTVQKDVESQVTAGTAYYYFSNGEGTSTSTRVPSTVTISNSTMNTNN